MAEECKYTYVDGGAYGHSFGWCSVHGVHACCSPVGTTYGGGGASTLDNASLDLIAARKRIAELEAALGPHAFKTGYGLDGKQPNKAWKLLHPESSDPNQFMAGSMIKSQT
jgi:hypothetical protein